MSGRENRFNILKKKKKKAACRKACCTLLQHAALLLLNDGCRKAARDQRSLCGALTFPRRDVSHNAFSHRNCPAGEERPGPVAAHPWLCCAAPHGPHRADGAATETCQQPLETPLPITEGEQPAPAQNPERELRPNAAGMEGRRVETPFSASRGCLTLMTSSSADLHSVESETSTTDPSSCTATTLTGTDTVLPVRMAVFRTSVSCMHTQKRGVGVREAKKPENGAGQSGERGRGATLPRTLPLSSLHSAV